MSGDQQWESFRLYTTEDLLYLPLAVNLYTGTNNIHNWKHRYIWDIHRFLQSVNSTDVILQTCSKSCNLWEGGLLCRWTIIQQSPLKMECLSSKSKQLKKKLKEFLMTHFNHDQEFILHGSYWPKLGDWTLNFIYGFMGCVCEYSYSCVCLCGGDCILLAWIVTWCLFLVMCSMAMLYFKVYSSMCVLSCDFTHIVLPTVNCTRIYLGDKVNRSENWGSHSY